MQLSNSDASYRIMMQLSNSMQFSNELSNSDTANSYAINNSDAVIE